MMLPLLKPHGTVDLRQLMEIQRRVAERVLIKDEWKKLERIAGLDLAYAGKDCGYSSCVVLDLSSLEILEKRVKKVRIKFPYLPTFLAFRELEGMLEVAREVEADVYMVDGHGVAHPRRAGLASHLGVVLEKPTLGVAKSKLCGEGEEPPLQRGGYSLLREGGEVVGAAVRTKTGVKPVYVSVGHKLSLPTAIELTLRTSTSFRIPQPLRLAHFLATKSAK
ncbi:MAG: endonuclease V [Hadesarchaea archaeon]|nr:MAG: endonuclease V [Hadesarchaea archaeon]TDA31774.1 MAG: endonuclease V [Hadesarchaea archaeon]